MNMELKLGDRTACAAMEGLCADLSFGIALTKYRLACVMHPQCFTPVTT